MRVGPTVRRKIAARGLTLIEMLVVIGVAAVLIGIMLPVLGKVRESGRATVCLSNLRQLGIAFTQYALDNNGRFPRPAAYPPQAEDWIYWEPNRDPDKGVIVPYMGGQFTAAYYRCPSDDVDARANGYAYSYSVNEMICGCTRRNRRPLLLSAIVNPGEKVLLIDESSETADDGCWAWQDYGGYEFNILSNRHDRRTEQSGTVAAGFGNVCYADGHAGRLSRAESFVPRYYDPLVP